MSSRNDLSHVCLGVGQNCFTPQVLKSLDKARSLSLKFLLNTLLLEVLYKNLSNYVIDVSRSSVVVTTSNTSLDHLPPSPFSIAKPQISIIPFTPPLGGHVDDQGTVSRNFSANQ